MTYTIIRDAEGRVRGAQPSDGSATITADSIDWQTVIDWNAIQATPDDLFRHPPALTATEYANIKAFIQKAKAGTLASGDLLAAAALILKALQ